MRDICKIALRLTILMVIAGLCLGAAYTVTKDPIARQEAEQKEMARKAVLEEAVSFEEVQLTDGGNVQECYRGLDAAGNPCGYAMSVTAKGFGGDIQLTVGVKDGVVTGVGDGETMIQAVTQEGRSDACYVAVGAAAWRYRSEEELTEVLTLAGQLPYSDGK